ncbi:MAG: HAD hydrolase-like protein [Zavarzinia sp.]|nr:HAD hydrolase-like protein [Zavarzinia sp.]
MLPLVVAFDCDGVLLDSNGMKIKAFTDALSSYPADVVARFSTFQQASFGLSRYRLVDRFFTDFLGRQAEAGEKERVLAAFGAICADLYPRQSLTEGALAALERLAAMSIPMFVVSGSDQAELRAVLRAIGLARFFRTIYGSPETKSANLARVGREAPAVRTVFVGDAEADWKAAREHGCDFYYLSTWAADRLGMARLKAEHGFVEVGGLPAFADALLGGGDGLEARMNAVDEPSPSHGIAR